MSQEPFADDQPEYEKNADGEQKDPCERIFKRMRDAFKSGTAEAKQKARESAPDIESPFGKAAYAISYGAAFGSSFGITMAQELVSGVMKEGGTEGFKDGKAAAQRAVKPKQAKEGGEVVVEAEYTAPS